MGIMIMSQPDTGHLPIDRKGSDNGSVGGSGIPSVPQSPE